MSIQIAIVGPVFAGKSCLLVRLKENKFIPSNSTLGVQTYRMQIDLSNKTYKVDIFDCQGVNDRMDLMQIPAWRKCSAFFVVVDITDQQSFALAKKCYQQLINQCNPESQMIIVIGNKIDLKEERKIDYVEPNRYWSKLNVQYVQTSAKFQDDKTIYFLFQRLVKAVIVETQSRIPNQNIAQINITIRQQPPLSSSGGCWC